MNLNRPSSHGHGHTSSVPAPANSNRLPSTANASPHKKASHQRSRSDATAAIVTSNVFHDGVRYHLKIKFADISVIKWKTTNKKQKKILTAFITISSRIHFMYSI